MSELNMSKLVSIVKKGANQAEAARQLGISVGQLPMLRFSEAQVSAGIHGKAPATGPSVKKLRDSEGNRWELIAARTGQSVARVKELYKQAGGNPDKSYSGRGRDYSGTARKARSTGSKSKTTSTRKTATGRKTAGGRKTAARKSAPTRSRTRAERLAAQGKNPS